MTMNIASKNVDFRQAACFSIFRVLLVCLLALCAIAARANNPVDLRNAVDNDPKTSDTPVSLPHLYWHFLLYQNHLDKAAADHEKNGKDGSWLRDHYQRELGLSDSDFSEIRGSARRLELELNRINTRVTEIIKAERVAHPDRMIDPSQLPGVSPELVSLQEQHEDAITTEVQHLRSALGPENVKKLEDFLETKFAPSVKVQRIGPPGPVKPVSEDANHKKVQQ
jgi:hypothetical protein